MSAQLSSEEVELFVKLYGSLLVYVNEQCEIASELSRPEELEHLSPETRAQVRDALLEQPGLIGRFIEENPAALPDEELRIVRSWQHYVVGRFFVFRYLKKHTVFLLEQPPTAYGVLALKKPFEHHLGSSLPVWVETVLLPFGDKIVYDGLLKRFGVSFGGGVKRRLNETYKEAKERMGGIVTSLPAKPQTPGEGEPRKRAKQPAARSASAEVRPTLEAIVGMTDAFCREYLNDEYAALCRKLAEKLARKRPSPLLRGKPAVWASGIVRTIGWVNFLSDPTQTPHMRLKDIDESFGIAESTGAARLKEIRTMLRIHQLEPEWSLPSRMDDNPLAWMLEVNGFVMDARHAPREIQEAAFEKGLIPYIPADKK